MEGEGLRDKVGRKGNERRLRDAWEDAEPQPTSTLPEPHRAQPEASQPQAQRASTLRVPVLMVSAPPRSRTSITPDIKFPSVRAKHAATAIPILKIEHARPAHHTAPLDVRIPSIGRAAGHDMSVPLLRAAKLSIATRAGIIDTSIPHPSRVVNHIQIPVVKVSSSERTINTPSIATHIPKGSGVLESESPREANTQVSTPSAGEPEGGGGLGEELPEFSELAFGVSSSELSSGKPTVVLYKELEDDYTLGSFEMLCLSIYRERRGGSPRLCPIERLDEFNVQELERYVRASGSLIEVNLDAEPKKAKDWFRGDNLIEPLKRCIAGDVGFIIFKTQSRELYEHCRKVLGSLQLEIKRPLKIVYVEPPQLTPSQKEELSRLAWGNFSPPDDEPSKMRIDGRLVGRELLDDLFNKLMPERFEGYFKKLKEESNGAYVIATKPHEGRESYEHKRMKWFVVKVLTRRLIEEGILRPKDPKSPRKYEIEQWVLTEEDTSGRLGDVVADVMDVHHNEVYEAETLFMEDGEGKDVLEKLIYTINKYRGKDVSINIVLEGLTLMRHIRGIRNVLLNVPPEDRGRVRLYTLDLQNERLMPYSEVVKRLKRVREGG